MAQPIDIAHVIQLAVAPVFLLSSLGTLLGVLVARLGRIVDRMRVLLDRRDEAADDRRARIESELAQLVGRRGLINAAIGATTLAALLVCLLIAAAFLGSLFELNTESVLAALFVLAMVAFVTSLLLFLREVWLASSWTPVDAR